MYPPTKHTLPKSSKNVKVSLRPRHLNESDPNIDGVPCTSPTNLYGELRFSRRIKLGKWKDLQLDDYLMIFALVRTHRRYSSFHDSNPGRPGSVI